jgi:hypothetical protein
MQAVQSTAQIGGPQLGLQVWPDAQEQMGSLPEGAHTAPPVQGGGVHAWVQQSR